MLKLGTTKLVNNWLIECGEGERIRKGKNWGWKYALIHSQNTTRVLIQIRKEVQLTNK